MIPRDCSSQHSSPRKGFVASLKGVQKLLPPPNKPKSRNQSPAKRARPTEQQNSDLGIKRPCLVSIISSSASTFSYSTKHSIIPTALDVGATVLERLVKESLRKERVRSDPDGTWVAEIDWMNHQDGSVPMSQES